MGAIYKRELKTYFNSMMGMVFIAVFFFFSGLYFFSYSLMMGSASLSGVFDNMFLIVLLLIPILTMRIMSEERHNKTDQALLTAPVNLFSIVMGKFLAAFTVFIIAMSINIVYGLVLTAFGNPDWLSIVANFIGQALLGAAFIAIGIFISSLTESQVIAAVCTFGISLLIILTDSLAQLIGNEWLIKIIDWISFNTRYNSFAYGVINIADIIFFISVCAIFIFLTIRVLDRRRWN